MQRFTPPGSPSGGTGAPLVLIFERNDAVAVPLLAQLRQAGYDVRAARIPVEVFDLLQKEPVELVLIDLGNAAANRREFWVGLDSQRRTRNVHVITFRYMATGETGELDGSLRVARADVEIQSAQGFAPLIEAVRARLPGATPIPNFEGPPPNLGLPPTPGARPWQTPPSSPLPGWQPLGPASTNDIFPGPPPDDSPFAQPYASNPFKKEKRGGAAPTGGDPFLGGNGPLPRPGSPVTPQWQAPVAPAPSGLSSGRSGELSDAFAAAFGPAFGPNNPLDSMPLEAPRSGSLPRSAGPAVNDAWTPPSATPAASNGERRGIAYRGYEDEPLAPDDPRIDGDTSEAPAVAYKGANGNGNGNGGAIRNERALSSLLQEGAVMAPQKLDALRTVQQTLASVGMDFSLGDLALLFRFLTPDQLLAALLVSRGHVTAEQIATLGRVKQEMLASGKDYTLEELLVMFNILPADQVRALRAELS